MNELYDLIKDYIPMISLMHTHTDTHTHATNLKPRAAAFFRTFRHLCIFPFSFLVEKQKNGKYFNKNQR